NHGADYTIAPAPAAPRPPSPVACPALVARVSPMPTRDPVPTGFPAAGRVTWYPAVLLCGDIGGTKTTLALFSPERLLEPVAPATKPSREFPGLWEIVAPYVATHAQKIDAACFGIAGPVVGGPGTTTNLRWVVDAAALRTNLGGVPVFLLNDLEALAYGALVLPPDRLAPLNPGRTATGTIAVIAAGTGLGEAGLVWDGTRHVPFASEGGHADFGPRTEREIALLRYLLGRFSHVL